MADKVAVLIPCYNEAVTIGKVVDDFKRVLPDADIYVYDNNSKDDTAAIAEDHGAIVRTEPRQGKGNVVRQMFREIDADYYIMVDGDDTYPAEAAPRLLEPLMNDTADMTVGDRLSNGTYGEGNDRAFHGFGNNLVRWLIKVIYGYAFDDVMTGYRAFNRIFVKTMPVLSEGFQIETELSIHAVDKRFRITDVPIDYRDRPEGSYSKLSTFGDGAKVLRAIASLFKDHKRLACAHLDRAGPDRRHSGYCGILPNGIGSALPHRHPCDRTGDLRRALLHCWHHLGYGCKNRTQAMGTLHLSSL